MEEKKKTWRELEAEGVRRCCVHFKDGTQCRRRASEQWEWSWCDKHGPTMAKITEWSLSIKA